MVWRSLSLPSASEVVRVVCPYWVIGMLLELDKGRFTRWWRSRCDSTAARLESSHTSVVMLIELRAHSCRGWRIRSAGASLPERAPEIRIVQRGGL